MNTTKDRRCPKGVLKAVMLYARAVKCVEELAEMPDPDSRTEYHVAEFLADMERMLAEQVVSSLPNEVLRETVLRTAGLESMIPGVRHLARDAGDGQ